MWPYLGNALHLWLSSHFVEYTRDYAITPVTMKDEVKISTRKSRVTYLADLFRWHFYETKHDPSKGNSCLLFDEQLYFLSCNNNDDDDDKQIDKKTLDTCLCKSQNGHATGRAATRRGRHPRAKKSDLRRPGHSPPCEACWHPKPLPACGKCIHQDTPFAAWTAPGMAGGKKRSTCNKNSVIALTKKMKKHGGEGEGQHGRHRAHVRSPTSSSWHLESVESKIKSRRRSLLFFGVQTVRKYGK